MTERRFDGHLLDESRIFDGTNSVDLVFVDKTGNAFTLGLPVSVAVALIPILVNLAERSGIPTAQSGQLVKRVSRWSVGVANEAPFVLLRINDEPNCAFDIANAKSLWRQIRVEVEKIERRPPPRQQ